MIPPVLALLMGVIDLFMSDEFTPLFFLIGMIFLLPQLTANYLKKKSHKKLARGLNLIFLCLFWYLFFFDRV